MEQSWRQFHGQGLQVQFHLKGFLHRILFQAYFPSKSLFLSTWVIFIVFYTDTHSFIFQIIKKCLQDFAKIVSTCTKLRYNCFYFSVITLFFSALNRNKFKNVFRFPLRSLSELSRRVTRSSSVSFPFLFLRTRHGGVGQRSGTGLETPLLGWALPLKILNHVNLGVDVPVFFHPGDVASFSYFFSSIHSLSIHSQWLPDT